MSAWLLFALLTAITWSVGALFSKKSFMAISPLWSNVYANAMALLLYVPVALLATGFRIETLTWPVAIASLASALCLMSYFYVISQGKLALTSTLLETYPVITVLLSVLFLHEHVSFLQVVGIGSALCGSLLIALPMSVAHRQRQELSWIWWGLGGAVAEGIADFLSKAVVNQVGVYSQIFYLALAFQIGTLLYVLFDHTGRRSPAFTVAYETFIPAMTGLGFIVLGTMFLFFAFQYGPASAVTPITASSPALIVLLAVVFLRERLTPKQITGIVCSLAGIILISIGGR